MHTFFSAQQFFTFEITLIFLMCLLINITGRVLNQRYLPEEYSFYWEYFEELATENLFQFTIYVNTTVQIDLTELPFFVE